MAQIRHLLFINPHEPPTPQPLLDSVTRKMCAAFRQARTSDAACGGVHQCRCRATSTCVNYYLPDGTVTNSLCIHYVAHHRASVPIQDLRMIESFGWGEADPVEAELKGPKTIDAQTRTMVERSLGPNGLATWQECGLDFDALCRFLQSYGPEERDAAENLLGLLLNLKFLVEPFLSAMKSLTGDATGWGACALRLPDWDRSAWLAPMVALLGAEHSNDSQRRGVACHFRYLRSRGVAVPEDLNSLAKSTEEKVRVAASIAIQQLVGE